MTPADQLKVLNNKKASKEQLRAALAASLGVEYEPQTKEKQESVFTKCRRAFLNQYNKQTGLIYSFGAKDGKALKDIIEKITDQTTSASDDEIVITFEALIQNLPEWYIENAFSLTVINGKFNEIVASIRKNGKQGQSSGNDLKSRLAERFRARQSYS